MSYKIACSDSGMECAFTVESDDEKEVMKLARTHAADKHGMSVSDDDLRELMQKPA